MIEKLFKIFGYKIRVTKKMEEWVDPRLLEEVRKYGKFDVNACLNCGGCTIVCSLSSNGTTFSARRVIQYARLGLKDKLRASLDPWLCYYCGECSTSCPRQTETGESMMTLRRYLIGQYDWTGFTSRIYKSTIWMLGALSVSSFAMLALILLFFYPHLLKFGHLFELTTIPSVALLILIPNILKMYWFSLGKSNLKPHFSLYISEFIRMVLDVITHKWFRKCKGQKGFWYKHLFVFAGYIITLTLTVFFGGFMTYSYPIYHPFKLAMIIIPPVLFIFTAILIVERIKKREARQKFSQLSDWLFPIWLFMMIFMLFLSYICLSVGLNKIGYVIYSIHLVVLSQWALVIVPFGKWTHFLYRPLAMYFHAIKERAIQMKRGREGKLALEEVR